MFRGVWSAAAVAAAAVLTVSGPAFAQDSIYWTNSDAIEPSIAKAGLNGTDAEVLIGDLGALNMPRGITMNPAAEKIYWSNSGNDNIARAELNGCCAQILTAFTLGPHAMTIQPELGNLYWTNVANDTIGKSQLNGQNALQMSGGGAPVNGPTGIALNRASGRLYWVNYNDNTVGYMDSADGSNGGQLVTGASPISQPVGLAIDTINNRALWTNTATNDIGYSNLDGTGVDSGTFNVGSAPIVAPTGIAIDPDANRVYWSNSGTNQIAYANLDGTGNGGVLDTSSAPPISPFYLAILKRPKATVPAAASPTTSTAGSTLTCTPPEWQNNIVEGALFNAPAGTAIYTWSLNDSVIADADSATLTAADTGSYTCSVTATNQAGSTTSTSSAVTVRAAPTPTPTPSPTPTPNCPTVNSTITKPIGKRGRTRSGSSRPGVRLIATTNVTADLNVTATGTFKSAGRTRKVTLTPVSNMQVGAHGRRFALFTPSAIKRGQQLKLKITVTPTPATSGCKAQSAATTSQTRTVTKIVTTP